MSERTANQIHLMPAQGHSRHRRAFCYIEALVLLLLITFTASFVVFVFLPGNANTSAAKPAAPKSAPPQIAAAPASPGTLECGPPYSDASPPFEPYSSWKGKQDSSDS